MDDKFTFTLKSPITDEQWDKITDADFEHTDRIWFETKHGKVEFVKASAQPESCEYYALCRHGRDESKLRARLGVCEYCNKDVDGYVKPIEKNCHAFVHFGMNGWELSLKANGWRGSAKIRYCPMCGRDLLVK